MKNIDTSKSLIFSRKVEDLKNAMDYLYQDGYCSNSEDFSEYEEGTLDGVHASNFMFRPFEFTHKGDNEFFSYFIPKSAVVFIEEESKKKTLRPYKTLGEFRRGVGSVLTYRKKSEPSIQIITSIQSIATRNEDLLYVYIDCVILSPAQLLADYEYLNSNEGKWFPFGVEE